MRRNLSAIWMVSRREFTDQLRDWRIVVPMLILVSVFPFIADYMTHVSVSFMNRFGGNLILDRLVPFLVLVIGFFPLSFTLVVALEAFVGEKERGTIEPLLSSPLEDSHMYLGKLFVGIATPLVFSYLSIGIYLVLVSRHAVQFPNAYMLALIFLLTFAHAVLMVSSAIVISVQATTIRSANLLASFVVVPVALLLQGETFLIFWGNEDVLWYAVLGVTLLAALLVRLGLSHFRREYLLGREIDTLNFKLMGRTVRARFIGQATSVFDWYRMELPQTLKQLRRPLMIILGLAVVTGIISYLWVTINISRHVDITPARMTDYKTLIAKELVKLDEIDKSFPAPLVFLQNVRVTFLFLVAGLVSFGTLGLALFMVNVAVLGGVLGVAQTIGLSPWLVFATGILPHGIFELTAIFLAAAAMLKAGAQLVTPQPDKSLGEILLLSLADWLRVYVGLVLPLLLIAALVEIYVTAPLFRWAFPYF